MRVLVFGAHGMLGKQLLPELVRAGLTAIPSSLEGTEDSIKVDITSEASIQDALGCRPDLIINCAAYTAVDKAESEPAAALSINALGPRNIATVAHRVDLKVIQLSTDYVYGGSLHSRPIKESEPAHPCGVYGYSKYLGDELLRSVNPLSMIIRTSWLHGLYGPNFVHTMLKLFKEREEIKVVNDQFGSPTWAGWLAAVLVKAAQRFEPGVFHASNRGVTSWYEFARAIADRAGTACRVLPQSTAELSRPAPRPPYSALDCTKLENLIGETCQSWEEGLNEHLRSLQSL